MTLYHIARADGLYLGWFEGSTPRWVSSPRLALVQTRAGADEYAKWLRYCGDDVAVRARP